MGCAASTQADDVPKAAAAADANAGDTNAPPTAAEMKDLQQADAQRKKAEEDEKSKKEEEEASRVSKLREDHRHGLDTEDHTHDLDVGHTLGHSDVKRVKRSDVYTALFNALHMHDEHEEDAVTLKKFVDNNMFAGMTAQNHVWHPHLHQADNVVHKPKEFRRRYVAWMSLDRDSSLIALRRALDKVLEPELHTTDYANYTTVEGGIEHFNRGFSAVAVTVVVDDHFDNKAVVEGFTSMPGHFSFLVTAPAPATTDSSATESKTEAKKPTQIRILHFNDVYHAQAVSKTDPVGGADRFYAELKRYKEIHDNPLVLFSGDAFSPSIESTISKGAHMVPILNKLGIHCSMFGNHDFDFGCDVAANLADRCNFPWLLTNVLDGKTKKCLARGLKTKMLHWNGLKIGVMGLAEKEWIECLPRLPENGIEFVEFLTEGKRLSDLLRSRGADVVIALTHMRDENDLILARAVAEVDLVLGGHDHFYRVTYADNTGVTVVKSGSDFQQFSYIEMFIHQPSGAEQPKIPENAFKGPRVSVTVERIDINQSITPDPEMYKLVMDLTGEINRKMDSPVGRIEVPFDCTFETVRAKESAVGNLMADVMRRAYETDIALLCGGAIRSGNTFEPGSFSLRDVLLIFPFEDPCVIIKVTGQALWETLENGVMSLPKLDGRFPHLSGARFVYDIKRERGNRVVQIWVGEEPVDRKKEYTMATRGFMAAGNDGFTALKPCPHLMDEENGHMLSALLRNYFWAVGTINRMHENKRGSLHIQKHVEHLGLQHHHDDAHNTALLVAPKVEGRILTVEQAREVAMRGSIVHISQLAAELQHLTVGEAETKEQKTTEEATSGGAEPTEQKEEKKSE